MMENEVERLVARAAITDVLYRNARANDRKDPELMRSCFWPESTHKFGSFQGSSYDFVDFAMGIVSKLFHVAHYIGNPSVELEGDRAFTECYYAAHQRRPTPDGGEDDAFFEGRYLDFHERRNGEWRIIHRRGLSDLTLVVPAPSPYASWPAGNHSRDAPDDDYYVLRRAFLAGAARAS